MQYLASLFDSPRISVTEIIFFILLINIIILCRKDGHRVYLAWVLFFERIIDLSIKPILPWDLIISQSVYFSLNIMTLLLIVYRVSLINYLRSITPFKFKLFNNNNTAKEQIAISYIYGFVAILCLGMIGEHILRHPELIGLSESLAIPIRLLYDSYPLIVTALTYLLILILFIMTIDGWAIRKMRAMEEKRNAKKRLG
ncbi:hypothetical protein [Pseudoalteromonas piscicida]